MKPLDGKITAHEADEHIRAYIRVLPAESVELAASVGRTLREPIKADRAYPPIDRVCMDGIAILYEAYAAGSREFRIIGTGKAGDAPMHTTGEGTCIEVMTGAPCPLGYDTVIPVEQVVNLGGYANILSEKPVKPGQHVQAMGSDCPSGRVLLTEGQTLNPARIAIAASVGMTRLMVTRRPLIRVVATGNEIVEPGASPQPWQMRRSNAAALEAMTAGIAKVETRWVEDDVTGLHEMIRWGLEGSDLLILSGGVSEGKFDFVPTALESSGALRIFHKIAIRPGKPIWFGQAQDGRPIFGLPGNPVSFMICFRRFVMPLLQSMTGIVNNTGPTRIRLGSRVNASSGLTLFLPVKKIQSEDGYTTAVPSPTNGSGDFCGLGNSDGFVEIATAPNNGSNPERGYLAEGEPVPWYPWEG